VLSVNTAEIVHVHVHMNTHSVSVLFPNGCNSVSGYGSIYINQCVFLHESSSVVILKSTEKIALQTSLCHNSKHNSIYKLGESSLLGHFWTKRKHQKYIPTEEELNKIGARLEYSP